MLWDLQDHSNATNSVGGAWAARTAATALHRLRLAPLLRWQRLSCLLRHNLAALVTHWMPARVPMTARCMQGRECIPLAAPRPCRLQVISPSLALQASPRIPRLWCVAKLWCQLEAAAEAKQAKQRALWLPLPTAVAATMLCRLKRTQRQRRQAVLAVDSSKAVSAAV